MFRSHVERPARAVPGPAAVALLVALALTLAAAARAAAPESAEKAPDVPKRPAADAPKADEDGIDPDKLYSALVRVQTEQLVQRVNLYLALGGGFEAAPAAAPVAQAKE